jgi:transposase
MFWTLRSVSAWRYLPQRYGTFKTCHNRLKRWPHAGIWMPVMDAITDADGF